MLSEKISAAGDGCYPEGGAEEVEKSKGPPAHAEYSGQRPGKDAQAEDEAGNKNGGCAIAGEHVLALLQHGRRNPKSALIAVEQRTPAIVAEGVTHIAAERAGAGGHHDDPAELERVFGIGHGASQQQRDL